MKNNKGFTLIELLVVVLIIGILAAIAVPKYQFAVEKARTAEAFSLLSTWYKARQLYLLNNTKGTDDITKFDIELPSAKFIESSSQGQWRTKHYTCYSWGGCYRRTNLHGGAGYYYLGLSASTRKFRCCWGEIGQLKYDQGRSFCKKLYPYATEKPNGDFGFVNETCVFAN